MHVPLSPTVCSHYIITQQIYIRASLEKLENFQCWSALPNKNVIVQYYFKSNALVVHASKYIFSEMIIVIGVCG